MLAEVNSDKTGRVYSRWGLARDLKAMLLDENETSCIINAY